MQNKIQDLLNIISNQENQINELQYREEKHIKMINNLEQITNNLSNRLENQNNNFNYNNNNNNNQFNNSNNQYNNNQYNNNQYNYNQYNNNQNNNNSNNNNNQYNNSNYANNPYYNSNNDTFKHTRRMTFQNQIPMNLNINNNNNNNNYPNINTTVKVVYNPYLPSNTNPDNLLTRPHGNPLPQPAPPQERKPINLDNFKNEF